MKELKVSDVRLRGRGFTLLPVCQENGVDYDLMEAILWAIHISTQTVQKEGYCTKEQMEKKRKKIHHFLICWKKKILMCMMKSLLNVLKVDF